MKWRHFWPAILALGLAVAVLAGPGTMRAGQSADLTAEKDLTPESLMHAVAGFAFELGDEPQDPDVFLQRRRGDCDDFAQLASRVLTAHGYHAKQVVVMMGQQTHVVCYVQESRGYLDYNRRADPHPVVASDGSLDDIAQKVALSFRSQWTMASEFQYENKRPRYLAIVFPQRPRAATALVAAGG